MCLQSDSGWGVVTEASSPCLGSDAGYQPVYPPDACPWGLGWVLDVRLPGETESNQAVCPLRRSLGRHHYHSLLFVRSKSLRPACVQGEGNLSSTSPREGDQKVCSHV